MSMTETGLRIHPNSLTAFNSTSETRSNLEQRILGLMADGVARTDRDIATVLNHPEPLRPRITNLIRDGLLHEVGSRKCEITQKTVRITKRFL